MKKAQRIASVSQNAGLEDAWGPNNASVCLVAAKMPSNRPSDSNLHVQLYV